MTEVRFEEPAYEPFRSLDARQAFADALRAHPDRWALLGKYSTSGTARQQAYQIRRALNPNDQPFAPVGSFEALARDLFGEYRVYVRFVGGEAS